MKKIYKLIVIIIILINCCGCSNVPKDFDLYCAKMSISNYYSNGFCYVSPDNEIEFIRFDKQNGTAEFEIKDSVKDRVNELFSYTGTFYVQKTKNGWYEASDADGTYLIGSRYVPKNIEESMKDVNGDIYYSTF